MTSISFLNNRQIENKSRFGIRNCNTSLNLDHVFSRLVCHKKDIFSVCGLENDVPPFACKFRKDAQSHLLAVANEDGYLTLYDTSKQYPESELKSFIAHQNAVFDICWLPDKYQLITGSGDHSAALWDMTSCEPLSFFKKHTSSVKSIDVCLEQSAIFATGSRDGCVNIWDARDKACCVHWKPSVQITLAHCRKNIFPAGKRYAQKDPISSVSAVAFQDSNHIASAGVADGKVKIWDLRRTYLVGPKYFPSPKYQMNYADPGSIGQGCTSLVFDSQRRTLYGCITNNKIVKFNCHSYIKEADVYEGFRCTTYFVRLALSSDDQYLLSGSSDDTAYIWKTSKPGLPFMKLNVHEAEVTSVCWSPYDITKLVTCGDDNKVAIWKIAESESPSKNDDILAVAESYVADSKNEDHPVQVTAQRSSIVSNIPVKKSPTLFNQTPNKPALRSIKSFFSPVAPSTSTPIRYTQSAIAVNSNSLSSPSNELLNKSSSSESSQILTPCNHFHKNSNSHLNQCSGDSSGTLSSPEIKNSSLENKKSSPIFPSSSLSVQNKENSSTHISPETVNKKNSTGQTKRKIIPKHSTPNLKKKQTENSKRTKGLFKQDTRTTPAKTITNYFSAALLPETK